MKNLGPINDELDLITKKYVDTVAETKVDKVNGKQLSTNDFTNEDKNKLETLPTFTEVGNGLLINEKQLMVDNNQYVATGEYKTEILEGTKTTVKSTSASSNPEIANFASIKSSSRISYDDTLDGTNFNVTLNGVTKNIAFGADEGIFDEDSDIELDFQAKFDEAFGTEQIKISIDNGVTGFDILKITANGVLVLTSATEGVDMLELLHIESGATNVFDITAVTIASFINTSAIECNWIVNNVSGTISTTSSLQDFFDTVGNSEADATIVYDIAQDSFIIQRKTAGALEITYFDDVGIFDTLGIYEDGVTVTFGSAGDAILKDNNNIEKLRFQNKWVTEESDPTVPDWAKQPNKPAYDYSEILNTPMTDTEMSDTSTNSVQNKVVKEYVDSTIVSAIGTALGGSY